MTGPGTAAALAALPAWARLVGRSVLFSGLSGEELDRALDFFFARVRDYPQGALLHRADEPVQAFGLVLEGVVQVYMNDIHGGRLLMASVPPGETFGESMCFLRQPEPSVYMRAAEPVVLLHMRTDRVLDDGDGLERELQRRFISMLARRTLDMNSRIQILSKRTLRGKLVAFFTEWARRSGSATFSVPFDRASMADYLGTDRAALSRELSRMRREGVIDFYKNSFRVTYIPAEEED